MLRHTPRNAPSSCLTHMALGCCIHSGKKTLLRKLSMFGEALLLKQCILFTCYNSLKRRYTRISTHPFIHASIHPYIRGCFQDWFFSSTSRNPNPIRIFHVLCGGMTSHTPRATRLTEWTKSYEPQIHSPNRNLWRQIDVFEAISSVDHWDTYSSHARSGPYILTSRRATSSSGSCFWWRARRI